MKYCSKCGSQNEDSVMFCKNCGNQFENNDVNQQQTQYQKLDFLFPQQNTSYQPYFKRKSSFWVMLLRVFSWIVFSSIILFGIISGGYAVSVVRYYGAVRAVGVFMLFFVGSVIIAFLSVAMMMIYLELADNVLNIRRLSEEQMQLLQLMQQGQKQSQIQSQKY